MKNLVKASAITTLALALAGCMSSGPKVAETRVVNLPDAQVMPTPEQVKDPGYRIVVSPVRYASDVPEELAEKVYGGMESLLLQAGNKVIDRSLANELRQELEVAESEGRFNTSGVVSADVAVLATVESANLTYSFTERRVKNDDGERKVYPAHCDFAANSKIDVKAYFLPEMTPVGTWKFEGRDTSKSETNDDDCPISNAGARGLLTAATQDAVEGHMHELLTPLAPNFYVLERRDGDSGTLFRTNLGSSKGAKAGATVKLFKLEEIAATEYSAARVNRVQLGEGEIVEGVRGDMSYVYVSDKDVAQQIRRGHVVQLKHSKCGVGKTVGPLGICLDFDELME